MVPLSLSVRGAGKRTPQAGAFYFGWGHFCLAAGVRLLAWRTRFETLLTPDQPNDGQNSPRVTPVHFQQRSQKVHAAIALRQDREIERWNH